MKTTAIALGAFVLGITAGAESSRGAAAQVTPADAGPPLVTGIGGVFFKAADPAQLRAWYTRHLGIDTPARGTNFLWREQGDPARAGMTVWAIFPNDTAYFGSSEQRAMINYRVRDLELLLRKLRAEGVRQAGDVQDFPYGRFAWVLDGEGNRIELWQPKP